MRSLAALFLFVLLATAVLAFTIVEVPIPAPLPLRMEQARHGLVDRIAGAGGRAARAVFGRRWLPPSPRHGATGRQVVSAFYGSWDEASPAALARHVNELDWVIPAAAFITGPEHHFESHPDPQFDAIIAGAQRRPLVLPMIQNATNGQFDGPGITALLHDPRAAAHLLDLAEQMVAMRHGSGIVFDFEEIPPEGQRDYLRFLDMANRRFDQRGWTVSMAAPVGDPGWNLAAYSRVVDKIFLMLYDEHWGEGDPGPVASQGWYVHQLQAAVHAVGTDKAIATIANYGYNWTQGQPATALTVEEAW
ncbi:MAG: polysaccharide deacetylase, partial [Alphaproteobacteria bacterium]|nr:polysaccharide deacetylase [Alphaproteobacteria bacterium]